MMSSKTTTQKTQPEKSHTNKKNCANKQTHWSHFYQKKRGKMKRKKRKAHIAMSTLIFLCAPRVGTSIQWYVFINVWMSVMCCMCMHYFVISLNKFQVRITKKQKNTLTRGNTNNQNIYVAISIHFVV